MARPSIAPGRRYRVMEFDRPLTDWLDSLAAAQAEAIRLGVAEREGDSGPVYLIVPARIAIEVTV